MVICKSMPDGIVSYLSNNLRALDTTFCYSMQHVGSRCVASKDNFCRNVRRESTFFDKFSYTTYNSNWSTICCLIADRHALKRHLIARHKQTRLRQFELHQKPSNASACKMSFWTTEGFLTSPTITTMCFITLMEVKFCASSSILSRI